MWRSLTSTTTLCPCSWSLSGCTSRPRCSSQCTPWLWTPSSSPAWWTWRRMTGQERSLITWPNRSGTFWIWSRRNTKIRLTDLFICFILLCLLDWKSKGLHRIVIVVVGIRVEVIWVRVSVPSVIKTIRHVAEDPGHVGDNLRGDCVHLLSARGDFDPGIVAHALGNIPLDDKTSMCKIYLVEWHQQEIPYWAGNKKENVLDDDNHVLLRTHHTHVCHTRVEIVI